MDPSRIPPGLEKYVCVVGDSNVRPLISILKSQKEAGMEIISAGGCSFFKSPEKNWDKRVEEPLLTRLGKEPEVNMFYIHIYIQIASKVPFRITRGNTMVKNHCKKCECGLPTPSRF